MNKDISDYVLKNVQLHFWLAYRKTLAGLRAAAFFVPVDFPRKARAGLLGHQSTAGLLGAHASFLRGPD